MVRIQLSAYASAERENGIAVAASAATRDASWLRGVMCERSIEAFPLLRSSIVNVTSARKAQTQNWPFVESTEQRPVLEPLTHGHVVGDRDLVGQLAPELADQPVALCHHVVTVDRLEVLLPG